MASSVTHDMTHEEAVAAFTGGLAPADDELPPFAGSERLRADGRPHPEFRAELRRIPNLRNAGLVLVALAYPFVVIGAAVALDHPVSWVLAFCRSALARLSEASKGLGSMTNRRSPFFTICPSAKCTDCRYPETRARTSTRSTASKRPVNSSHSVISRTTGRATSTDGGAADTWAWPGTERHCINTTSGNTPRQQARRIAYFPL